MCIYQTMDRKALIGMVFDCPERLVRRIVHGTFMNLPQYLYVSKH